MRSARKIFALTAVSALPCPSYAIQDLGGAHPGDHPDDDPSHFRELLRTLDVVTDLLRILVMVGAVVLQRDHHAASLGLSADLMRSGNGIRLLINSSAGGDLPELLNIRLAHPTQSGFDQVVKMKLVGQGFYEGSLLADINGRWHVSIEDPAGKWRLQGDWRVDSEEPLRVTAKAG